MQIAEGAARWASTLREHGVRPDDRVIVLAGSGLDWLEVILGVMKVGAVDGPLHPDDVDRRTRGSRLFD